MAKRKFGNGITVPKDDYERADRVEHLIALYKVKHRKRTLFDAVAEIIETAVANEGE